MHPRRTALTTTMPPNQSITFFDTQFQKQVAANEFALNPFETVALPFVRGRVLDFGCGLGNLGIEAARRGATVTAVDASETAIARIRAAAEAEKLPLTAVLADVRRFPFSEPFDTIVAIGLLMFFRREVALEQLGRIQEHVASGGRAVVNVLVEGTTFLGMFEPDDYTLFGRDELEQRFADWNILLSRHDEFAAPGNTQKAFATLIAEKY